MRSFLLLVLWFLSVQTLCHSQCPVVLPASRIVGGHVPSAPQALSLTSPTGARCSASLLSPTWALTAAHCHVTANWTIAQSPHRYSIQNVITHHLYTSHGPSAYWHDISLLHLSEPFHAPIVLLDARDEPIPPGAFVRAIGHGRTSPRALRQIDLPVSDIGSCNAAYNRTAVSINEATQLCAGYQCVDCTPCLTCKGDSGGPLVQFDDYGNAVQVGIISLGFGCVDSSAPGVYLRLSSFVGWIEQQGAIFTSTAGAEDVFAPSPPTVSSATGEPQIPEANIADERTPAPEIENSEPDPLAGIGESGEEESFGVDIQGHGSAGGLNPTVIVAPAGLIVFLVILILAVWFLRKRLRNTYGEGDEFDSMDVDQGVP